MPAVLSNPQMGGVLDPSRDCAFTGTIDGNKIQVSTLGGSIGYAGTGGAGGAITQLTNKSTAVTLNAICGAITTSNASLANATAVGFTVTNNQVAATDVVLCSIKSGATVNSYVVGIDTVAAGSFHMMLYNFTGGSLSEAVVINFAVIKAATN